MSLDDGHAPGAVRLLGVGPEEVFVGVGGLGLLLLRRDHEAAFGGLAGRRGGRGGRGPHDGWGEGERVRERGRGSYRGSN